MRRSFKSIGTQTRVAGQTRCFGGSLVLNHWGGLWPSLASASIRAGLSRVLNAGENPRSWEIPPEQYQEMDCAALDRERTRLVAERADLKSPLLSSNTDAEREAELTQLNGKLYTVEKAQFAKSCPLVANAPPSPPSAVVQ